MVTKKSKGLGRGLEALLGASHTTTETISSDAAMPTVLPLSAMQTGKYQPRVQMDESLLEELAASIKQQGLLQPILVRPIHSLNSSNSFNLSHELTHFEIIAGERRYRAAQLAGLTEVPVLVKHVDDQTTAAIALIENIQREDLNPLEEAHGIARLINDFSFTHEQAAASVGRSRSAVSNLLRLIHLAKPVQTMLMAGDLDMGHARALLTVDPATQIILANQVVAKRMSVRETEKLVGRFVKAEVTDQTHPANQKKPPRDQLRLEEELSDLLAMPVHIKTKIKKNNKDPQGTPQMSGQLTIDFVDLDSLDHLIDRLRSLNSGKISDEPLSF